MSNDNGNNNAHPYYPFLKWGFLHTPFMIFIRSYNKISDEDIMKTLGLQDYQKIHPPVPPSYLHVVFASDTEWTHIADDYLYTLWYSPKTAEAIEKFSKSYDVFRCSIGDIDESFEFEYYQNGSLTRKLVFEHDAFKNSKMVIVDIGTKLPSEPENLSDLITSSERMFPNITQSLGIARVNDPSQNRFYGKIAG